MRGIEKPERPKRSGHNNKLRDAEVEEAFDVIEDEAVEFKKFSSRLHEVNKLLKETLQELKKWETFKYSRFDSKRPRVKNNLFGNLVRFDDSLERQGVS